MSIVGKVKDREKMSFNILERRDDLYVKWEKKKSELKFEIAKENKIENQFLIY